MLLCIYINNQVCTIYSYQLNATLGAFGGGGGETGGGGGRETGGGGEAEKGGGGGAEDTLCTVQFVVALKETVATTRECIGCFSQYCIYFGMVVNPRMGEKAGKHAPTINELSVCIIGHTCMTHPWQQRPQD